MVGEVRGRKCNATLKSHLTISSVNMILANIAKKKGKWRPQLQPRPLCAKAARTPETFDSPADLCDAATLGASPSPAIAIADARVCFLHVARGRRRGPAESGAFFFFQPGGCRWDAGLEAAKVSPAARSTASVAEFRFSFFSFFFSSFPSLPEMLELDIEPPRGSEGERKC